MLTSPTRGSHKKECTRGSHLTRRRPGDGFLNLRHAVGRTITTPSIPSPVMNSSPPSPLKPQIVGTKRQRNDDQLRGARIVNRETRSVRLAASMILPSNRKHTHRNRRFHGGNRCLLPDPPDEPDGEAHRRGPAVGLNDRSIGSGRSILESTRTNRVKSQEALGSRART